MARRTNQPKELVRLSPRQFSFSVSIVVILLGGAGLAGYFYGLKQAIRPPSVLDKTSEMVQDPEPARSDTQPPVTFYSTLTKPREDVTVTSPPRQEEKKPEPAAPPLTDPGIRDSLAAKGAVMLQVASYKEVANARKLLTDLSKEGYAGTVARADLGERGVWFRVRVGPYNGKEEAERVLVKLRDEKKLKGFIVK